MTEITRSYQIMIVGEAFGDQEEREGRPFVGAAGLTFRSMLRHAGIPYDDCYATSVFNFRPPDGRIESLGAGKLNAIPDYPRLANNLWIAAKYQPELDRLWAEIATVKPNVVIALGAVPLWALCKQPGIKKFRGTPLLAIDGRTKVIPTYNPAAVLRQWKLRPIVIADLEKARLESASPRLIRPRRFIHLEPSLADIADFYKRYIAPAEAVSADIETKQGTITEIGFAPSPDRAIVIPFYDHDTGGSYWPDVDSEIEAWRWVARICEKPLVGQNFSYDIQYLWSKNRIQTPRIADDTMLLHHAMYPEMEKSLGFLGSVYTNEPSWKFMRADNETLKQED